MDQWFDCEQLARWKQIASHEQVVMAGTDYSIEVTGAD
jgi:hypothetical protein